VSVKLGISHCVDYKPYLDPYIGEINDNLRTHRDELYTDNEAYTINGFQGDTLVTLISVLLGSLIGIGMAGVLASTVAEAVIGSILSTLGINIVGGEIMSGFTETVSTIATHYDLKVYSPSTLVTKYYDGAKYIVTTENSSSYDETIYEGYYPQFITEEDNAVALWLFNDFYAYPYPGVNW
jgi:hypothetical protein